jgi:hypothetical protein
VHEISITIPLACFKRFEPNVQRALTEFIISQLGKSSASDAKTPAVGRRSDGGLAMLDVTEAKYFLNKCNDKSIRILNEIVKRNGDFLASEIAQTFGSTTAELRGVWAGLTKRVRTVTKDPEAHILRWFKQGDNGWHATMAKETVVSMRIALSERG